jgi:hypothetical protein
LDPSGGAVEQAGPKMGLQSLHAMAHHRRGKPQLPAGRGQAALFDDAYENPNVLEKGHPGSSPSEESVYSVLFESHADF